MKSTYPVEGCVLAGGQSLRMGANKALITFQGMPLVVHAVRRLQAVCSEVRIAGGDPSLAEYAPQVPDTVRYQGPLGGIVAALFSSCLPWCLFTPVDMPLLPVEALLRLLSAERKPGTVAVLAEAEDHVNPLVGLYHRQALPVLARELEAGRLRARAAIEAAGQVVRVPFQAAEEQDWFRNLNTPEDLRAAAETAERR